MAVAASDDTFYILNKAFWQKWQAYVGLPRKDSFSSVVLEKSVSQGSDKEKSRRPIGIGNDVLRISAQ